MYQTEEELRKNDVKYLQKQNALLKHQVAELS